jgi:glutaredoxin
MAKQYLDTNGFEYEEIRVDTNPEAREFLISEGHRTMPQIYNNGKLLVAGGGQALVRMNPDMVRKLIGEVIDVGDIQL